MNMCRNVLCIVGPTGSGKSSLAITIAKRCGGEIISADAVAVYRGLDIGSAKPTVEERQGIPHYLIDCVDITDADFSVSEFRTRARDAIDGVLLHKKLPIVVGGSGLYVDAIFSDMRFSAPSDPGIRAEIDAEYDRDRNGVIDRLRRLDPATGMRLHPNDRKRIVRALEVMQITGKPFSALNRDFESAQKNDGTYQTVRVGICLPRDLLYQRIDARVDQMVQTGLKEEAYSLFERGLTPDRFTAMRAIGYAQFYDAYLGRCTEEQAIEAIKLATRRFAKRQFTWFKRDAATVWLDASEMNTEQIATKITELL